MSNDTSSLLSDVLTRLAALEALTNTTAEPIVLKSNDGDNAWMLTATALVYLMTPALAFFYGGMVHRKNILGTLLLSFICMGIVTFQWLLFGFSLAFGPSSKGVIQFGGGSKSFFVEEFGYWQDGDYAPTYPLYTYCMFQCAFAVITPALISGSVVNKMKIPAFCLFVLLWTTVVYDVIAFWIWNPEGWLRKIGSLDWAGGVVIHISSGFSAAVCTLFFEFDSGAVLDPQPAWTVLGGGLLWFGWLGFNGGSACNAGPLASLSFLNTNAGAAAAACTWGFLEYLHRGRTSAPTMVVGAVVGLVVITPAAGFVRPGWALMMGVWGTALVYGALQLKNRALKIDDPLDVWICHGIGGLAGALLTGLFAEEQFWIDPDNPGTGPTLLTGLNGSFYHHSIQFAYQLVAVVSVIAYASTATALIMVLLKYTIGIKISKLEHVLGMDGTVTNLQSASEARQKEALVNNVLQRALVIFSGAREVHTLTPDEEGVLHEVFGLFDADGGGTITVDEFHKALSSLGLSRPKKDVVAMFASVTQSDYVNFENFKKMFIQTHEQMRRETVAEHRGQRAVEAGARPEADGVEMV